MTTIAHDQAGDQPGQITFLRAMRVAWWSWFAMLILPFVLFLGVVVALNMNDDPSRVRPRVGSGWFVFNMAYLAVSVPLAFFVRSHLFKRYYNGQSVSTRHYLMGMMIVWIVLEIGGILSIAGTWFSGTFGPNIIPAVVAFVLFLTQWPKGNAIVRPTGDKEDFEQYEEPR